MRKGGKEKGEEWGENEKRMGWRMREKGRRETRKE